MQLEDSITNNRDTFIIHWMTSIDLHQDQRWTMLPLAAPVVGPWRGLNHGFRSYQAPSFAMT